MINATVNYLMSVAAALISSEIILAMSFYCLRVRKLRRLESYPKCKRTTSELKGKPLTPICVGYLNTYVLLLIGSHLQTLNGFN